MVVSMSTWTALRPGQVVQGVPDRSTLSNERAAPRSVTESLSVDMVGCSVVSSWVLCNLGRLVRCFLNAGFAVAVLHRVLLDSLMLVT